MAKKRYTDVVEMIRDLTEDHAFADDLGTHLAQRTLVTELCALRAARGLTQKDVAKEIGCTQGWVSRVESSSDGDLNLSTLMAYADAIGLRVEVTLMSKGTTLVSQVKHHAHCIKRLIDRLAQFGSKHERIAERMGDFLKEAACNLVRLVNSSTEFLPQAVEAKPSLTVETFRVDDCDGKETEESGSTGRRMRKALRNR